MDSTKCVDDHAHRGTTVPDAFETMSAGADDQRRSLPAGRTVLQRREVVAERLNRI